MISKELLSDVFTHGENSIEAIELIGNELSVLYRIGGWEYHNIHELAHKCKEWALERVDMIRVYHHQDTVAVTVVKSPGNSYSSPGMSVLTETEAIFAACQWILDNKEDN